MSDHDDVNPIADLDPELAVLAEEITRRLEAGEPVSAGECFSDNPACDEPIRRLLPAMQTMVSLAAHLAREEGARARWKLKGKKRSL